MNFISEQLAKDHLQLGSLADNPDVMEDVIAKAEAASEIVLDLCNSTAYWRDITPTWTELTVPKAVRSAMLLVLTHLYENRGNNMDSDPALWAAVNNLLGRHKDPVLA